MSSERRRLIATIVVAVGLVIAIVLLRRGRVRRGRTALEQSFPQRDGRAVSDEVPFVTIKSLDDARMMHHTAVVLQGGLDGQIYLTVPVKHVACDESALVDLLRAIDALGHDDPARAVLSYELAPIGSGIMGSRGAGPVVDGIWLHPDLSGTEADALAHGAIYGKASEDGARTIDRG
jgi:hypothetical protein